MGRCTTHTYTREKDRGGCVSLSERIQRREAGRKSREGGHARLHKRGVAHLEPKAALYRTRSLLARRRPGEVLSRVDSEGDKLSVHGGRAHEEVARGEVRGEDGRAGEGGHDAFCQQGEGEGRGEGAEEGKEGEHWGWIGGEGGRVSDEGELVGWEGGPTDGWVRWDGGLSEEGRACDAGRSEARFERANSEVRVRRVRRVRCEWYEVWVKR